MSNLMACNVYAVICIKLKLSQLHPLIVLVKHIVVEAGRVRSCEPNIVMIAAGRGSCE